MLVLVLDWKREENPGRWACDKSGANGWRAGAAVPPASLPPPRFIFYIYLCCLLHRTVDWAAAAAAGCLASFGLDGVVVV